MTEPEPVVSAEPKDPSSEPESYDAKVRRVRAEKAAAEDRARVVREARDEVMVAFNSHAELRQAVQTAVQAVEKALQACVGLDRKCSSQLGRQLFLGRRLLLKPALGVLGTALHHLKKAGSQMDSVARLREVVLEEAVSPELDH